VVHTPAEEANRKVSQLHDQREGPGPMISTAAVQLLHEGAGRGPTKAKTLINEDVVTVLLADTLTKGRAHAVDNGRLDRVLPLRHDYQSRCAAP
jgi:UTP-glucose-1-phosphate uridylyltransferase